MLLLSWRTGKVYDFPVHRWLTSKNKSSYDNKSSISKIQKHEVMTHSDHGWASLDCAAYITFGQISKFEVVKAKDSPLIGGGLHMTAYFI